VVSFTPGLFYFLGKSSHYSLDRRLGGTQSRFGLYGEVKILDPNWTRTPILRESSPQSVAIPTELQRLKKSKDIKNKEEVNAEFLYESLF
jgi:hypothetical protein